MGIDVKWDDSGHLPEKTLIYWTFEEGWDWNDFSEADKRAFQMALDVSHTVHSIIDFRASSGIPGSGAISYFTRSIQKAPPNRGTVVVVGAPGIIKAMEGILRLLSPQAAALNKYPLVDTPEEAYTILQQYVQENQT